MDKELFLRPSSDGQNKVFKVNTSKQCFELSRHMKINQAKLKANFTVDSYLLNAQQTVFLLPHRRSFLGPDKLLPISQKTTLSLWQIITVFLPHV
jgi:hypothetical protein